MKTVLILITRGFLQLVLTAGIGMSASCLARAEPSPQSMLVAAAPKKKKNAKKKPKPESDSSFGPEDVGPAETSDNGIGVHREQEGVDVPYKAEVALLTDLSFMNKTIDDKTSAETNLELSVQWLFIVSSFEVGPDVSYQSQKTSQTVTTTNSTTNTTTIDVEESNTTSYALGGLFKWNFADIDHADLVPFAYGGFGIRSAETKVGDSDAAKSSGNVIKVGGGLNIFLDSNVAFNPRAEYRIESNKDDNAKSAVETKTSGFKILIGIASFI